jgi:DNA-binding transcriptional MerR regulator
MQEHELELTIEELAEQVSIPVRTIRFYIAEGLLQGPGTRGKAAVYSEEHLLRLRLIRRLSERRVPLVEMRDMLSRLSLDEVRSLLTKEDTKAEVLEQAAQTPSPKAYIATLLNRAQQSSIAEKSPPASKSNTGSPQQQKQRAYTRHGAEVWQRWELAPGVELHVRTSVQHYYRELIEQLLRVAQESEYDT